MHESSIFAIFLHREPSAAMEPADSVSIKMHAGLEGDHYSLERPDHEPDQEVTLIEWEAVEGAVKESGIPLSIAECRRNLVTKGVRLNPLVGQEFEIGDVRLKGIRLCHPCSHLQGLTRPGVLDSLKNRGGLRAQVLAGGTISVGDAITIPTATSSELVTEHAG
jgi:MOSC domain-containing protein YiiM